MFYHSDIDYIAANIDSARPHTTSLPKIAIKKAAIVSYNSNLFD